MILLGFSIGKLMVGVLTVSLSLLVLIIAYRKLLAYLGKGNPPKEKYCVLFGLENPVVTGEVEFYFTSEEAKKVALEILDENMQFFHLIVEKEFDSGGNIVRFDSTQLKNGNYYYQLRTDNQKTMKKIRIQHPEN
jgi:hypothetical protein